MNTDKDNASMLGAILIKEDVAYPLNPESREDVVTAKGYNRYINGEFPNPGVAVMTQLKEDGETHFGKTPIDEMIANMKEEGSTKQSTISTTPKMCPAEFILASAAMEYMTEQLTADVETDNINPITALAVVGWLRSIAQFIDRTAPEGVKALTFGELHDKMTELGYPCIPAGGPDDDLPEGLMDYLKKTFSQAGTETGRFRSGASTGEKNPNLN